MSASHGRRVVFGGGWLIHGNPDRSFTRRQAYGPTPRARGVFAYAPPQEPAMCNSTCHSHSLGRSFTRSLVHSLTHSDPTNLPTHPPARSLAESTHSLNHSLHCGDIKSPPV